MNRLIIVGSPRTDGRSAHLADLLFESCIDECPDDELALAPVSTLRLYKSPGATSNQQILPAPPSVKSSRAGHQPTSPPADEA